MNKLFRLSVVAALAITLMSTAVVVPNAHALAPIGDCPTVEVSYDGGQTWSECNNWGRWEDAGGVTCYYSC